MANFTHGYFTVIKTAERLQSKFNLSYVGTELILYAILSTPKCDACAYLNKFGATNENYFPPLKKMLKERNVQGFTVKAISAQKNAVDISGSLKLSYVSTEHLLLSILSIEDCRAMSILRSLGVDIPKLYAFILERIKGKVRAENITGETKSNTDKPVKNVKDNVDFTVDNTQNSEVIDEKPTPLDGFGYYLTDRALKGEIDVVLGRDEEISRVIQTLSRKTKNSPLLLGEAGVGKTAVVEGLALKIASGEAPEFLRNKKIFSLDLTGMVAGTKYRGDFEERIKAVIEEVTKSDDVIVFIDEIHTIIGAGSAEGSTDAANILKPSLARGDLQVIGATTLAEYRKNIEKDSALERRFQPVTVGEPNEQDAISILMGLRDRYEGHHKVKITDGAVEAAVKLSSRYITDRYLPDKAIDLIDEAGSRVRLATSAEPDEIKNLEQEIKTIEEEKDSFISSQNFEKAAELRDKERELSERLKEKKEKWQTENKGYTGTVTENEIADIVSHWTGIPTGQLTEEESERLLKMEDILHSRIVGQNEAVTAVSKAIRRGRVGLKDPRRPTGSFIFLGPTGVGKTELCKALAEAMFGSEDAMIRLDMSEYMEKHTVSRIVGSPPGYVGFEEGGQLTEKVRRKPYSVVLFDEIEKAHPDVFNILLQILEDGIFTDSQGRMVDFKNTVVIMTSNIGARLITDKKTSFGFSSATDADEALESDVKNQVLEELKRHFRPEFLNRVDDTIVFSKLGLEDIKKIAKNMLKGLKKRLAALEIDAEFDESAITAVADAGFDKVYGARPLRRAIQSKIEDALSEKMLDGSIK